MSRLTGLALAVVLVVVIGREARAQSVVTARRPTAVSGWSTRNRPPRTASCWTAGGCWRRRRRSALGAGRTRPDAAVQATPTAKATRPARTARSLSRIEQPAVRPRRRSGRDPAADRIAVLAGSRDGCRSTRRPVGMRPTGKAMVSSPYGSIDYGMTYKGMYWGY